MAEINWTLINDLHTKPHPLVNIVDGAEYCIVIDGKHDHSYVGEVLQEASTVHHILDLAGVPRGHGYSSNEAARTFLLLAETISLRERLDRIGAWHSRETGPAGMVGDYCNECGGTWPCDTNRMAEGIYVDDDEAALALPEVGDE